MSENPNPCCPKCASSDTREIMREASEDNSTEQWSYYEDIQDISPDKWICSDCSFKWYPRAIVERDLDFLTWQLALPQDEAVRQAMQRRLGELRPLITILAEFDMAKSG